MKNAKRKLSGTLLHSPAQAGLLIGYGRISTNGQTMDLQTDALEAAGCAQIFIERESRSTRIIERPEFKKALLSLRAGDTLVVWKLDRLGGNLVDVVLTVDALKERGIQFRSLTERIDTGDATGRMFFQFIAVMAEFERTRLIERTKAGLAAARARGRMGGRPAALNPKQVREARALLKDPEILVKDVCAHLGVSRSTLYKYLGSETPATKPAGKNARKRK